MRRGFSVVEMLFAVAIIGVLAVIAIPSMLPEGPPPSVKRIARAETVFFASNVCPKVLATAEDGSTCRYVSTLQVVPAAGNLLECRWQSAEAAR